MIKLFKGLFLSDTNTNIYVDTSGCDAEIKALTDLIALRNKIIYDVVTKNEMSLVSFIEKATVNYFPDNSLLVSYDGAPFINFDKEIAVGDKYNYEYKQEYQVLWKSQVN